jgi:hypothetical protein
MENLPESVLIDPFRHRHGRADRDEAEFPQVGQEDADNAEREVDVGGDVRHCCGGAGELKDAKVFGA